ncbi:MAG: hypothetical protein ACREOD_03235 [Candidatus Dormibacteria bacterium]
MAADERTPGERIRAFADVVDDVILRPLRRYLRGFRVGLALGAILGAMMAPGPGEQTRARLLRIWRTLARRAPGGV